jgi:ABC-2 type transport system ATP-binding protein
VSLTLGVPVTEDVQKAFDALPNVSNVTVADHTVRFIVQGDVDPVLKKAAAYPIVSMTSHEPTLEEAFLEYYRGEGADR